jgi:hypothetical protein
MPCTYAPTVVNYALDGLFSFSDLPLQWITLAGAVICVGSFAYAGILVTEKLLQMAGFFPSLRVLGFTTLAVAIFFFGGLNLFALGVVGQYIARIYREIKGRPLYIVQDILASDEKKLAAFGHSTTIQPES